MGGKGSQVKGEGSKGEKGGNGVLTSTNGLDPSFIEEPQKKTKIT